jgi:two-component system phosphate regulon response regulator PhoB
LLVIAERKVFAERASRIVLGVIRHKPSGSTINMPRVLFVEDNALFAKAMRKCLRLWGYEVEQAWNGEEAERLIDERRYDLALIDWNLPGPVSGLQVCRKLRATSPTTGISFLTGRQEEHDKVTGLSAGADDYIVKNTGLSELRARIEALYRRSSRPPPSPVLRYGPIEVDLVSDKVVVNGSSLDIPKLEYRLLVYFLQNIGRPISREELRKEVFGVAQSGLASNVRRLIFRLRSSLGDWRLIQWRSRKGWGIGLDQVDSVTKK